MRRSPASIRAARKGDRLPVEGVSWWDAVRFCNALSEREGLTLAYHPQADEGIEWEHACRAGTTGARYGPLHEIGAGTSTMPRSTAPTGYYVAAGGLTSTGAAELSDRRRRTPHRSQLQGSHDDGRVQLVAAGYARREAVSEHHVVHRGSLVGAGLDEQMSARRKPLRRTRNHAAQDR